jgi:membrane associated rhomboid family serine protease
VLVTARLIRSNMRFGSRPRNYSSNRADPPALAPDRKTALPSEEFLARTRSPIYARAEGYYQQRKQDEAMPARRPARRPPALPRAPKSDGSSAALAKADVLLTKLKDESRDAYDVNSGLSTDSGEYDDTTYDEDEDEDDDSRTRETRDEGSTTDSGSYSDDSETAPRRRSKISKNEILKQAAAIIKEKELEKKLRRVQEAAQARKTATPTYDRNAPPAMMHSRPPSLIVATKDRAGADPSAYYRMGDDGHDNSFGATENESFANDALRKPSPHHRVKLNQWYAKQGTTPPASTSRDGRARSASAPVRRIGDDGFEVSNQSFLGDPERGGYDGTALAPPTSTRGGWFDYYSRNQPESDDEREDSGRPRKHSTKSGKSNRHSTSASRRRSRGDNDGLHHGDEDDGAHTLQDTAYLSIMVTTFQLLILVIQIAMCGLAPLDINPMIGPYPDAFSEWGGKNSYLMLVDNEWWRLVSPIFLHVGVLHLLANAFCQLEAVALFEREWGSARWLVVYILSGMGGVAYSSVFDANTIAVGSSGALMGMYAAKLSQVMSHTFFEVSQAHRDFVIRLDQLSGVLCGLTLVSLLSSFTYIDWSGHMGGLVTGFFTGMLLFSWPIESCCMRFLWMFLGFAGLVGSLTAIFYVLYQHIHPEEELGDACQYFRNLYPENYECECVWGDWGGGDGD